MDTELALKSYVSDPVVVAGETITIPDIDHRDVIYSVIANVRESGGDRDNIAQAITETLQFWYRVARNLRNGVKVEEHSHYVKRHVILEPPRTNKSHITVFGDVPTLNGRRIRVTMTENTTVQEALDCAWAMIEGGQSFQNMILDAAKKAKANAEQSAPPAPAPAPVTQASQTVPFTPPPAPAQSGVMKATYPPMRKRVNYAPGQQVAYDVNRVAITIRNDVLTYQLWGPLGQKYPLFEIFTDNPSKMAAFGDELKALGLSLEHPGTAVNWELVATVSHDTKDGNTREFITPLSITKRN